MEPAKTSNSAPSSEPTGELILQNGKHNGARRSLGAPLTLIGKAEDCHIRLKVEGIEPYHCLIVAGPDGLLLRDLSGTGRTFLNDERVVNSAPLSNGDALTVGAYRFRLNLTAKLGHLSDVSRDAMRIQAAAVAAQQIKLDEAEAYLMQRRASLDQREQEIIADAAERERQVTALIEQERAARAVVELERAEFERQIINITGNLTQAQRDLLTEHKKVQAKQTRLAEIQQRLKKRWDRHWRAERRKLDQSKAELDARADGFAERAEELCSHEEAIQAKRLRFNALYELGRCRLKEAWGRLKQDQYRWKHRRGKERAALRVRSCDLDSAAIKLAEAQRLFIIEKRTWDARKDSLQLEIQNLETRVENHRVKLSQRQRDLERVGSTDLTLPSEASGFIEIPANMIEVNEPSTALVPVEVPMPPAGAPDDSLANRERILERLTGDLMDQRLQLLEQWRRLAVIRERWEQDSMSASVEIETLTARLVEQGEALVQREASAAACEESLRVREERLKRSRHQLIAWGARLRIRENSWDQERTQMSSQMRYNEELTEKQRAALIALRQRWSVRRREEFAKLQKDRAALEASQLEHQHLRTELDKRGAEVSEKLRILTEKSLAFEQFRQETLAKFGAPVSDQRVARLRRRLITQNASVLRNIARDRELLQSELHALEQRYADLQKRADALCQGEAEFSERQSAWEHKQVLSQNRQARTLLEIQEAQTQRGLAEQQVARTRDEIERIARALLEEPEQTGPYSLENAA